MTSAIVDSRYYVRTPNYVPRVSAITRGDCSSHNIFEFFQTPLVSALGYVNTRVIFYLLNNIPTISFQKQDPCTCGNSSKNSWKTRTRARDTSRGLNARKGFSDSSTRARWRSSGVSGRTGETWITRRWVVPCGTTTRGRFWNVCLVSGSSTSLLRTRWKSVTSASCRKMADNVRWLKMVLYVV